MRTITVRPGTKLEQLLKFADLVSTGGEAKLEIQNEQVRVNNKVETRRGYKLKDGDIVDVAGSTVKVLIEGGA